MKFTRTQRYRFQIEMKRALVLLALCMEATFSAAQQSKESLPTVAAAAVPFYPAIPRAARIEGTVRLRLTTDGKRVSAISVESGPPLLIPAAEENVKTWYFKPHTPTMFEVVFQYKMLPESSCDVDDGEVLLRLPAYVEVNAKGVQTCDPEVEKKP